MKVDVVTTDKNVSPKENIRTVTVSDKVLSCLIYKGTFKGHEVLLTMLGSPT